LSSPYSVSLIFSPTFFLLIYIKKRMITDKIWQNRYARAMLERAAALHFAPAQYKLGHAFEFAVPARWVFRLDVFFFWEEGGGRRGTRERASWRESIRASP
jgi:hypothetical protein